MVTVRDNPERRAFIASPPGKQDPETVRQFRELQRVIADLQARLDEVEAWALPLS